MTASTASAKAMSVAVGMAHPRRASPSAPSARTTPTKTSAGMMTPPTAAVTGTAALATCAQLTDEELALELEPGDEEEDGEQTVRRPVPERQPQLAPLRPDVGALQGLVGLAPRAVREDQRRHGRGEQEGPAGRLGAQGFGDVLALRPRRATQDGAVLAGGSRVGHGLLLGGGRDAPRGRRVGADQTSRRSVGSLSRVGRCPPGPDGRGELGVHGGDLDLAGLVGAHRAVGVEGLVEEERGALDHDHADAVQGLAQR